jgi:class 3 adenylate cyclase
VDRQADDRPDLDLSPPVRRPSSGRWGAGSIQTKLLLMLLLSSILSAVVVGLFAYRTGTASLRDEAYERLEEIRDERTTSVRALVARARSSAVINSRGLATEALPEFSDAFDDLADVQIRPGQRARLDAFYADVFVPRLQEFSDGEVQPESFVPTLPARSYLQATYTARAEDFDQALAVDDAGDGSRWSAINARYQPFFRKVIEGSGADDIMLLNTEGDIVWTAYKGADLGSNITRGEYRGGGLEDVFDRALRSNSVDFTAVSDLELYQPSYNAATGFVASPVTDADDEIIGVYVIQVSIESINAVMTGDARADVVRGLGKTGETFLTAQDGLMRSNSRALIEDPERYLESVVGAGTPRTVAERAVAADSTVMRQRIASNIQQRALAGDSGTLVVDDYLGQEVLASYGPAEIPDLDWAVIAKVDTEEAFAPVRDFARTVLISTALVILLVCAASLALARVFTSPLNRLLGAVRRVAAGELGAQVDIRSRDEFADLAVAFNDMSASLQAKQRLLEEQQAENERILLAQMPESVARRLREGETSIFGEHDNVSVAYIELDGLEDVAARLPTAEALELLNRLSRGMDDASTTVGIEQVRPMGTGYVASCGLVVQRVDHARRVVEFAREVQRLVDRINVELDSSLALRAGLHSGEVRSGLIGRSGTVYNLWGEAVNLAYRVRNQGGDSGVFVTDAVKQQVGTDDVTFTEAGTVSAGGATVTIWQMVTDGGRG